MLRIAFDKYEQIRGQPAFQSRLCWNFWVEFTSSVHAHDLDMQYTGHLLK